MSPPSIRHLLCLLRQAAASCHRAGPPPASAAACAALAAVMAAAVVAAAHLRAACIPARTRTRAAFVAAMAGKQVAIVAPTTLLARQHAKTFKQRFAGLPVEIRELSRLVSTAQAAQTKDGLAGGAVDIVIGTHALLAKSISFQRLGLVIVDEEQHFGVVHK